MAKRALKKKTLSFDDLKKKFSSRVKYKEQQFFDLGKTFQEVCGIAGPAMGQINMFLGHSDTGKTTALIKAAVDAQKKNILPVFLITEQKWSFEYAKLLGFDCEQKVDEETGELYWDGFFIDKVGFNYIEQAFSYITELLDAQAKGDIPYDLLFLWDSIGTIPCEMSFNGKGGNQHTARVISEKWGMGLAQRITSSRKEDSQYTNTMVFVNQPWVQIPEGFGQKPKIMPKGGNSIFLSSALVFLFGNQANAGTSRITATTGGKKITFATRTKVGVTKNHINGISYADRLLVTPHGFILDTPNEVKKYKEEFSDYWDVLLDGSTAEAKLEEETVIGTPVDYSDNL